MRLYILILILFSMAAFGGEFSAQEGWRSLDSSQSYESLLKSVKNATEDYGFSVVTEAGPTAAAEKRGIKILSNCVMGIFNNDFAIRVLSLSEAAMIEAPMRMYVTENEDGTADLSWKKPSFILSSYQKEGGRTTCCDRCRTGRDIRVDRRHGCASKIDLCQHLACTN